MQRRRSGRRRTDRTCLRLLFRRCCRTSALSAFQFLEAELIVFLRLADRFLHLQKLEAHFLDTAVELPDLFFKLLNPIGFIGLNPDDRGLLLRIDRAEATPRTEQRTRNGCAAQAGAGCKPQHSRHDKFLHLIRPALTDLHRNSASRIFSISTEKAT
ncbi:hypothetical protein C241_00250 [Bradyrhizobium lupini HPC(L)]|uniref:Uncharacterized protein n=1 Tax=Bradyrhizobium lupini HPC(L) TaxID=1229491 RepID=A0ABN0HS17_RHILU|nr:hypothetical protein C241_00250 [Bradyrhizobium lupini HPC(L)]